MREVRFVDSPLSLQEMCEDLAPSAILYLDSETSDFSPRSSKLLLIQLTSGASKTVWVVAFQAIDSEGRDKILNLLAGRELVMHNATFDLKFLGHHLGLDYTSPDVKVFDTFLAESVLGAGKAARLDVYSKLQAALKRRFGIDLDKEVRTSFVGHDGRNFTQEQIEYAAKDVEYLPRLRKAQIEEAREFGLTEVLRLEFELVKHVTKMEMDGITLDLDQWGEFLKNQETLREEALSNFYAVVKPYLAQESLFEELPFNVNSQAQVIKFFNEDLKLGVPDTNERTLQIINHPVCEALLEYREHEKLLSTFGDKVLNRVSKTDGRLHPRFYQCNTSTGRFSAKTPNVQQIPSKGEGKKLRRCFIPSSGYKLSCADYSQVELRILAEFSQEPSLLEAYNAGIDIHTQTASLAFGVPVEEVTQDQRKIAKILNFGVCYGGGPAAMARGLMQTISEHEAAEILLKTFGHQTDTDVGAYKLLGKEFVDAFFRGMPKAKEYLERSGKKAVYNRYSETPLGRKRFYPELNSFGSRKEKEETVSSVQRRGKNSPIQGCSADITKIALVRIGEEFRAAGKDYGRILLQVHDEIVCEVREDFAEELMEIQKRCMIEAAQGYIKSVPVEVDIKLADYWDK